MQGALSGALAGNRMSNAANSSPPSRNRVCFRACYVSLLATACRSRSPGAVTVVIVHLVNWLLIKLLAKCCLVVAGEISASLFCDPDGVPSAAVAMGEHLDLLGLETRLDQPLRECAVGAGRPYREYAFGAERAGTGVEAGR